MKNTVSLSYNRLPDALLDEFTGNVINCMDSNPAFPAPPVPITTGPPDALAAYYDRFRTALVAASGGGVALTAAKNQARQTLLDVLDKLALYVQTIARYDLAMLLTSGFVATSTNRAQTELDAPTILAFENGTSGQLTLRLSTVDNARGYNVQVKNGTDQWKDLGFFPQARKIAMTNLTPGTVYTVQARAVGGSKYYSDWSNPSSHMAT